MFIPNPKIILNDPKVFIWTRSTTPSTLPAWRWLMEFLVRVKHHFDCCKNAKKICKRARIYELVRSKKLSLFKIYSNAKNTVCLWNNFRFPFQMILLFVMLVTITSNVWMLFLFYFCSRNRKNHNCCKMKNFCRNLFIFEVLLSC